MSSRIIKVANAYDDLCAPGGNDDRAMERIHLGLGYEYDPRVVDSLTRVLERRRRSHAAVSRLTAAEPPRGIPAPPPGGPHGPPAGGGRSTQWAVPGPRPDTARALLEPRRYGVPVVRWASMARFFSTRGSPASAK